MAVSVSLVEEGADRRHSRNTGLCERLSGVDEGAEGAGKSSLADDPGHQS